MKKLIFISLIFILGCRADAGLGYEDYETSSFLGIGSDGLYGQL